MADYSIFKQQTYLEVLADQLLQNQAIGADDRYFIAAAFREIARGGDANIALKVQSARGKRKSFKSRMSIVNLQLALGWIASAIEPRPEKDGIDEPLEGGLGLTLEEAFEIASAWFNLTPETLQHEWGNRSEMRKIDFEIFYHPSS